jgi:hypothetical protein
LSAVLSFEGFSFADVRDLAFDAPSFFLSDSGAVAWGKKMQPRLRIKFTQGERTFKLYMYSQGNPKTNERSSQPRKKQTTKFGLP